MMSRSMLAQNGRVACWVRRDAGLPCDAQLSRGFVTPLPFQCLLAPDQSQSKHRSPSLAAPRRSRTQHPQRGRSSGGVAAWYSHVVSPVQRDPVRPAGELIDRGKPGFCNCSGHGKTTLFFFTVGCKWYAAGYLRCRRPHCVPAMGAMPCSTCCRGCCMSPSLDSHATDRDILLISTHGKRPQPHSRIQQRHDEPSPHRRHHAVI